MASERLPTKQLSAVERVKRENRRDMPMGFSSSLILHACLAALFASAVATLYVESKIQQPKEQPNQVITIETLVRPPQPVAQQKPQPLVQQVLSRVQPVPVKQTSSQASQPHVSLLKVQPLNPQTQTGTTSLGTLATLQGAPGKHHAKKHKADSKPAAQETTANSGTAAAATSTTIYTAPNSGNSAADDDAAAGGYMSPGRGPVWSEHPPTGPGGGGVDSCAPSRGGFFGHRHK